MEISHWTFLKPGCDISNLGFVLFIIVVRGASSGIQEVPKLTDPAENLPGSSQEKRVKRVLYTKSVPWGSPTLRDLGGKNVLEINTRNKYTSK